MSVDPIKTAYRASDLLRVCALAAESEAPAMPGDDRAQAEAIALVRGMFDEIIDALERAQRPSKASQAQDSPIALVSAWRALSARWKAEAAALVHKDAEGPEIEALSEQVEALCKCITASTPTTQADCGALIQWVLEDSDGDILAPMHTVVQIKVADFLTGATRLAA